MTAVWDVTGPDAADVRRARRAPELLRAFNQAGVLDAADVHVAARLGALGGDEDQTVLLGLALAVRAPRLGHVCVDVASARLTVAADVEVPVDLQALPWPRAPEWVARLAASPLVAVDEGGPEGRPLRLVGTRLYLQRYWREERQVAADLRAREGAPADPVDAGVLAAGLRRLFDGAEPDLQRLAAATAVRRRFTVVAGGPGTGKTTTVARILALLDEQAEATGAPPPRVALAAPTGKAAARLEEAVHADATHIRVGPATRARLLGLGASTLHRLLGYRPDSRSRFRHHRGNRLPHDVVVVDETSMVSLSLMARLVEAVRAGARLILVGDPAQLASVEAGAVLGDIVGPAADRPVAATAAGGTAVGEAIVVLRRVHRFGAGIAALAEAVRAGDTDAAVSALQAGYDDLRWINVDVAGAGALAALEPVRDDVLTAGRRLVEAAAAGDGPAALTALAALRVLCAHRRGPYGVAGWMSQIERWLSADIPGYGTGGAWYVGRPLLVTENDYALHLHNGDTGVVVAAGGGRVNAVFERRGGLLQASPARLAAVDTVHAMTVHKSQGSQFGAVVLLLPDVASPILTRELLYTGATRAQARLTVAATEASVRAAVARPIARASGLRDSLWGAGAVAGSGGRR